MCGICGIYNYGDTGIVDRQLLQAMCDVMTHRGPDEQGIYADQNLGLGVRRLSIIDLETGSQPIANEANTVVVILNGEIYNYQELQKMLTIKGHKFRTRSDTETIVHLYEEYGIQCLDHLNGMFAAAIWDSRTRELFVARDRMGIKPLYYLDQNGSFAFGSEMKVLLQNPKTVREIDHSALSDYLTFLYVPAPRSIFKGIRKLCPGHYLHVKNGSVRIHQYWSFDLQPRNGRSEQEFYDLLEAKFDQAVGRQMVSDVALGAFLSGGADSSMVVTSMAKSSEEPIKTFTVGFDYKGYDERQYAKRVADWVGADHSENVVQPQAFRDLPDLVWYFDEPFADEAALPTHYLSREARTAVKVALVGDGADELFAGYRVYQTERLNLWYTQLPGWFRKSILQGLRRITKLQWSADVRDWLTWLEKSFYLTDIDANNRYLAKITVFNPDLQRSLLSADVVSEDSSLLSKLLDQPKDRDFLEKLLSVGVRFNLPNRMLTKIDRASMAASLEVRVPFLDNEIVDFAAALPLNLKIKGLDTKHIVKKILAKRLPKSLLHRSKHGFDVPYKQWFRGGMINKAQDLLRKEVLEKQGLFNPEVVEKLLNAHRAGLKDNTRQIYGLVMFQLWYKTFIEREVWVEKGGKRVGFSANHEYAR